MTSSTSLRRLLCVIFIAHLTSCNCNAGYVQIKPVVENEIELWSQQEAAEITEYHIPVIGPTADGTLVAFSEGKFNGNGISKKFLAQRRSFDNGETWTPTLQVKVKSQLLDGVNLGETAYDNATGVMFLVYSQCPYASSPCNESMTYLVKSYDNGETWSNPVDLTEEVGSLVFEAGPGQGIQKVHPPHQGRIIFCGHSHTGTSIFESLTCISSDDHGNSWRRCGKLPSIPYGSLKVDGDFVPGENQVVELSNGTLLFTIRNKMNYHAPARLFARSYDGGDTIPPRDVYIEERLPDSGTVGGMIYLEEYKLLLHSNAINASSATNMTLSWSYDDGTTWNATNNLQIWPGPSNYSCLTEVPNRPGYVGLLYEKGGKDPNEFIAYASINLQPVWKD